MDIDGERTPPSAPQDASTLRMPARRARVLETVSRLQFASVADLSAAFGVSEVTIRNDLDVLAGEGMVRRVRGGAVHRPATHLEVPFEEAREHQVAARESIAGAAAARWRTDRRCFLMPGPPPPPLPGRSPRERTSMM